MASYRCADDADTDPRGRATEPSFCGLIHDITRTRVATLLVMTLAAFCKMLGVVLALALLIVANQAAVVGAVFAGRIGLMFVVKAAQQDLPWYFATRGGITVLILLVGHIATAILIDCTDFHLGRHPYVQGAMGWMIGVVWPWILLFAGVAAYNAHFSTAPSLQAHPSNATVITPHVNSTPVFDANAVLPDQAARVAAIDGRMLWVLAGALAFVWLCSNIAFALLCKPEYLRTFWSVETAAQYTKRTRWDGAAVAKRARVLTRLHSSYLRLFRDEAKQWLADNWDQWEEQKPEWFTERWKRSLPNSILTPALRIRLGGKGRRRSSVAEQMRQ